MLFDIDLLLGGGGMAHTSESTSCRRCGRPIQGDSALHADIFEGMHRLCFHLEYEHPGDPDLPCEDPGCPIWRAQTLEAKLRSLGVDPDKVIEAAIEERYR